jgi:hypothetical protein
MMKSISLILLLLCGLMACKSAQQSSQPQRDTPASSKTKADGSWLVGSWKVTAVSDLKLPSEELMEMKAQIIEKIVADLVFALNEDGTFTNSGFEGEGSGSWRKESPNSLIMQHHDGGTNEISYSHTSANEMMWDFRNSDNISVRFRLIKLE